MADPQARGFIWSESFISDPKEFFDKYPPGTDEWNYVGGVAAWYETIGTLWKHGLLDEDLLFDWLWVAGIVEPSGADPRGDARRHSVALGELRGDGRGSEGAALELERVELVRRLVLGEAPLQHAAREHADEAAVLDDRHALERRAPRGSGTPRRAERRRRA